jgi:hypothetical protein
MNGAPYHGETDVFVGIPTDLEAVGLTKDGNESKPSREELLELQQKYNRIERVAKVVFAVATIVFVTIVVATQMCLASHDHSTHFDSSLQIMPRIIGEANPLLSEADAAVENWEGPAVTLNHSNFASFLQENKYTFVNFAYPLQWKTNAMLQEWQSFAELAMLRSESRSPKVALVNCEKETELCREQGIQSYPTLRFFEGNQPWKPDYHNGNSVSRLMSYATEMMKGPVGDQF